MSSVSASTERREMASKGRSYQEFLIDSAAPNSNASFTLDKDSSVGARRAKFASTAKDLSLDRQTVCIDDPSSFTQRAMVRAAVHHLPPPVLSACDSSIGCSRCCVHPLTVFTRWRHSKASHPMSSRDTRSSRKSTATRTLILRLFPLATRCRDSGHVPMICYCRSYD